MTVEEKEQIKNANTLDLMCMLFDISKTGIEEISIDCNEPDLINMIEGIKELDEEVSSNGKTKTIL